MKLITSSATSGNNDNRNGSCKNSNTSHVQLDILHMHKGEETNK